MEERKGLDLKMSLNDASKAYLKETAKWSQFLAIVGFVGIGIMVIASFFMGIIFSALPNNEELPEDFGPYMTIVYLIMALIYFFPVLYLYKFSVKLKQSLQSQDEDVLSEAFLNLKSMFKFMGVLTILLIALYILIFLFGIIAVFIAM